MVQILRKQRKFYIEELADSSVNLSLRIWSNTEKYWDTRFYLMENIKIKFDQENIEIPFPQRDIHITYTDKN